MNDQRVEGPEEVFSRANLDYWYLEALPTGAVAEVDGLRYRKNNAGQWVRTA